MDKSLIDSLEKKLLCLTDGERNELIIRLLDSNWYTCSNHPNAGVKTYHNDEYPDTVDIVCAECGFFIVGQVKKVKILKKTKTFKVTRYFTCHDTITVEADSVDDIHDDVVIDQPLDTNDIFNSLKQAKPFDKEEI